MSARATNAVVGWLNFGTSGFGQNDDSINFEPERVSVNSIRQQNNLQGCNAALPCTKELRVSLWLKVTQEKGHKILSS